MESKQRGCFVAAANQREAKGGAAAASQRKDNTNTLGCWFSPGRRGAGPYCQPEMQKSAAAVIYSHCTQCCQRSDGLLHALCGAQVPYRAYLE